MKFKGRIMCFLALSTIGLPVSADFGVIGNNPSAYEYGNAQTPSFKRAMSGAGQSISAQEQRELSSMLPEREEERFYGRLRVNFSTLSLDELKNRSSGQDAYGAINVKRSISNQVGFEAALGYAWSANFRGDLEYLANKNLNYKAKPALTGSNVTARELNAQIKNNSLLANVYYDFSGIYRFKPYLTAGIGLSVNSVQASLTPPSGPGLDSNTLRSLRVAWQLGGGLRFGVFQNWFVDTSYRFIRLGNGLNIKPNNSVKLLGTYGMNAISLGVIYLF